MSLDIIEPTRERRSKSLFEVPSSDQKTNRAAYRALSIFQTLYASGKLNSEEFYAAERLERHYRGSLGVKVDDSHGGQVCDDYQPAQTVHASELARIERVIDCGMTWRALIDTVDEAASPDDIGRRLTGIKNRPQSYSAGLAVIKLGLRKIARTRPRQRDRP